MFSFPPCLCHSVLNQCADAFEGTNVPSLFEDLGRIFLLDMVLGNSDRLPCIDLGWRGNPSNIMYGTRGAKYSGRGIAIDSCVARRPPIAKLRYVFSEGVKGRV